MLPILHFFLLLIVGGLAVYFYKFCRDTFHDTDPDWENIADTEIRMRKIERDHRRMQRAKRHAH